MFIISEISPQFGNDLFVAEQMILQSKLYGASAVKLQLYPAEMFFPKPVSSYVKARELSFEQFERLYRYGERIGIPVFATAFDSQRLGWCVELGQPYYKVAARQHQEQPDLVREILALNRPTFVSVPAEMPLESVPSHDKCIFLRCVSQYPTLLEDVQMPNFRETPFCGLSDHSVGVAAAIMSSALGATHLEKHFTISHGRQRHDEKGHLGAMDAQQLEMLAQIAGDISRIPFVG